MFHYRINEKPARVFPHNQRLTSKLGKGKLNTDVTLYLAIRQRNIKRVRRTLQDANFNLIEDVEDKLTSLNDERGLEILYKEIQLPPIPISPELIEAVRIFNVGMTALGQKMSEAIAAFVSAIPQITLPILEFRFPESTQKRFNAVKETPGGADHFRAISLRSITEMSDDEFAIRLVLCHQELHPVVRDTLAIALERMENERLKCKRSRGRPTALIPEQENEVYRLFQEGKTYDQLAEKFSVDYSTVKRIIRKKRGKL